MQSLPTVICAARQRQDPRNPLNTNAFVELVADQRADPPRFVTKPSSLAKMWSSM
jgi:hypothetical protein